MGERKGRSESFCSILIICRCVRSFFGSLTRDSSAAGAVVVPVACFVSAVISAVVVASPLLLSAPLLLLCLLVLLLLPFSVFVAVVDFFRFPIFTLWLKPSPVVTGQAIPEVKITSHFSMLVSMCADGDKLREANISTDSIAAADVYLVILTAI